MNFPMDHTCWIAAGGGCFVAAAAWSGDFTLVLYLALDILKHVFNVFTIADIANSYWLNTFFLVLHGFSMFSTTAIHLGGPSHGGPSHGG